MNVFKRIGYVDKLTHGSTGSHVTYAWNGEQVACTCISGIIRKSCKHIDELIDEMVYNLSLIHI